MYPVGFFQLRLVHKIPRRSVCSCVQAPVDTLTRIRYQTDRSSAGLRRKTDQAHSQAFGDAFCAFLFLPGESLREDVRCALPDSVGERLGTNYGAAFPVCYWLAV